MAEFKDFPFEIYEEDENALLQPRFGNLTYEDTANSITYNLVPFVFLIIAFFLFRIFSLLGLSDFSSGGDSSSYGAPSSGYGAPSSGYGVSSSSYGSPSTGYGTPSSGYGAPSSGYNSNSVNSNFNSVNTNSLTVANPVPNLGGAKVADLYYLYPELFQNGVQSDQNIGNIDYTDDPQGEDYITRLLEINNYLGFQNSQQQQYQNGQPLQLRQRLGQPQHQIYDPYIITPEQLQMQLLQIEQAGK